MRTAKSDPVPQGLDTKDLVEIGIRQYGTMQGRIQKVLDGDDTSYRGDALIEANKITRGLTTLITLQEKLLDKAKVKGKKLSTQERCEAMIEWAKGIPQELQVNLIQGLTRNLNDLKKTG